MVLPFFLKLRDMDAMSILLYSEGLIYSVRRRYRHTMITEWVGFGDMQTDNCINF